MRKKLKWRFLLVAVIFIFIFSILFVIYINRIHIIENVSIDVYSTDTSDISKTKIRGIGPVGREFILPASKKKSHWETVGFFLNGITLELPYSFINQDKNFLIINNHKYFTKSIKTTDIMNLGKEKGYVVFNIQSVNPLSFNDKVAFFICKLPKILFGGEFYLTPILYLFLIFIILVDYKNKHSIKFPMQHEINKK